MEEKVGYKTTSMGSKGQVLVPVAVRRALDLSPGSRFSVDIVDGSIMLRPIKSLREIQDFVMSKIPPGTPPLEDVRAFYETREARL